MRRDRITRIAFCALALALLSAGAVAADFDGPPEATTLTGGPHARFLAEAIAQGLEPAREPRESEVELQYRAAAALTGEVYGWYPYWSTAAPTDLPYDLLTVISYFSVGINGSGNVTALNGWPDGALVDAAHAGGVRVVLGVTLFDSSGITTLLSSATNRANAIAHIVDQVEAGNADGAAIDFEGVAGSQKANLVTFMRDLRTALRAANPAAHLSIATPAVDWNNAFDYDQLAAQTDVLFVMAYDYHYKGGDPGPVATLYSAGPWSLSIADTLDDYEQWIAPYTLARVVLGLPLYGYDWPTTSSAVPTTKRANATSVTYAATMNRVGVSPYGSRHFDTNGQSPYLSYTKTGDGTHQEWYEDAASLALRFDYAQLRGTAGIGFWALGYEGGIDSEVWDEVEYAYDVPDPGDDDDDSGGPICGASAMDYVFAP